MSQAGPYGPENPPPPPPGAPPGAGGRRRPRNSEPSERPQESSQAPRKDLPYAKLNSWQRKARIRERERERLGGNDPPIREKRAAQRDWNERGQRGGSRSFIPVEHDSRQPLKEARQVTPSQALDETHGRLSPGMDEPRPYEKGPGDAHSMLDAEHGSPGELSWSPHPSDGEQTRQASHGGGHWDNSTKSPFEHSGGSGEDARQRTQLTTPAPPPPKPVRNAFDIEDEADSDEDDFPDVPAPAVQPRRDTRSRSQKPQEAAFKNAMARSNRRGKKRAYSPSREEQPWSGRRWQNKAQKTEHPEPYPMWGPDPSQHQPGMHLPAAPAVGQPSQHELGGLYHSGPNVGGYKERQPKTYPQALLEPDPALPHPPPPETTYDLRAYNDHITALHRSLPPKQRYINGNGKLSPYNYGSVQGVDLGLCFSTFYTSFRCEMGVKCAWRHHPLTRIERGWILRCGGERGRSFLESLAMCWAVPDVPVPGATMHDK